MVDPHDIFFTTNRKGNAVADYIEVSGSCWLWTGALNTNGYGNLWPRGSGRSVTAHRFVYEALVGPIPARLESDHLCRVRRCCNPDHIELVTRAENVRRSFHARGSGGRRYEGQTPICSRGHRVEGDNAYHDGNPNRKHPRCRTCEGTLQQ